MTGFHLQIIGIYLGSDARHNREGKICRFLEFACRNTLSVVCFRPRDADGFPSLPQESGAAGLSSQKSSSSTAPVSPGAGQPDSVPAALASTLQHIVGQLDVLTQVTHLYMLTSSVPKQIDEHLD